MPKRTVSKSRTATCKASAEGYSFGAVRVPYHGYYSRVLTQQGPNAPGGSC
jgi:hypothetical protein